MQCFLAARILNNADTLSFVGLNVCNYLCLCLGFHWFSYLLRLGAKGVLINILIHDTFFLDLIFGTEVILV